MGPSGRPEGGAGGGTPAPPSDAALVARSRGGDEEAFAALVRRHQRRVRAIAARFLHSAAEVDDLAQECFLTAFRKLDRFRGRGPFEAWLARIAVRLCYDQLRGRSREPGRTKLETDPAEVATDPRDPIDHLERRDLVRRFLPRLRPADRLVLTLQLVEGLSVAEVAALTGWSRVNVRVRASRARSRALRLIRELETGPDLSPGGDR